MRRISTSVILAGLAAIFSLALLAGPGRAQDEGGMPPPSEDTTKTAPTRVQAAQFENAVVGAFSPARGFSIIKSERGTLNISVYGLFRWVDQTPGTQTFTDHLGRERTVKARNDLNWHRSFVWFTGFFYDPKFRYNISVWSLGSTQQTLIFGNLQYAASRAFTLGVGLGPNLTARSMFGTWPFWASSDRQMTEEFMRAGFASCVFATGEPVKRLFYYTSLNTNLSQLGVTATNDQREMAYSGGLYWMPTTGEFGPRNGFGDLEYHEKLATRFGATACHGREDRGAPLGQANNETQLRLSDGVYVFEEGALADTVTVQKADYDYLSFDAGFKYRGFTFLGEVYRRQLSNFLVTGPIPESSITDTGWQAEAMHMVIPSKLGLYVAGGLVNDQFNRNPWELAGGASYYPYRSRSWRLNFHVIHVEKSPTGSNFGFYTAGQTGTTYSLGTDILL